MPRAVTRFRNLRTVREWDDGFLPTMGPLSIHNDTPVEIVNSLQARPCRSKVENLEVCLLGFGRSSMTPI